MGVPQASLYSMNVKKTSDANVSNFDISKIVAWVQLYWPVVTLVLFFSLFYTVYINFFTGDLGRHIVNGREIVKGGLASVWNKDTIFNTNYYSFTQAELPFTNHHWLFGVLVFLLKKIGGFSLLTWCNVLLNTLAFVFILLTGMLLAPKTKQHRVTSWVVTGIGFLLLPLLTHRTEIRPESVSLLFFSLYYYLFRSTANNSQKSAVLLKKKWPLILLAMLQIVWTNTHLFFILGPLLAGYFLFERILVLIFENIKAQKKLSKKIIISFKGIISDSLIRLWFSLFVSLYAVGLLNPNRIQGLLAPLTIFNNYAYRVAENQSTFFMIDYGSQVTFFSFVIVSSFFVLLLGIFSLIKKKAIDTSNYGAKIASYILVAIFAVLANKINRLTPFFAVVAIPFFVQNLLLPIENTWTKNKDKLQNTVGTMTASTLLFVLALITIKLNIFLPSLEFIGTGLPPEIQNAANFFTQNNLHGPIFNNYDIGGYLVYNLFPQEKLFIDNRPEAYSANFLTNEYLRSLNDENTWNQIVQKYNINVIFFYRHDQIDGAQQFLFNRVTDPEWVPVYVDGYALILVRNSQSNEEVILRYKLPQDLFVMNAN